MTEVNKGVWSADDDSYIAIYPGFEREALQSRQITKIMYPELRRVFKKVYWQLRQVEKMRNEQDMNESFSRKSYLWFIHPLQNLTFPHLMSQKNRFNEQEQN